MTGDAATDKVIAGLQAISRNDGIARRHRTSATKLLDRLSAPVRVGILARDQRLAEAISTGLDGALCRYGSSAPFALELCATDHGTAPLTRLDIGLWITEAFPASEADLWAAAPDHMKDHSFLVGLHDPATAAPSTDVQWVDAALDDFAGFVALRQTGESIELAPLVERLRSAIMAGRQAVEDHAVVLIEGLRGKIPELVHLASNLPVKSSADRSLQDIARVLSDCGRTAAALIEADDERSDEEVLSLCRDTAERISDIIGEADPGVQGLPLVVELAEGADTILLMSLETGEGVALDAVTTLLQLQKDIGVQLEQPAAA